MVMHFAITALIYILLLVLTYEAIILNNSSTDKSIEIITLSFNRAYTILLFGLLIVYGMVKHPYTDFDHQTTSFLILGSKFISLLTLGGSFILLYRKSCKNFR
ncbi:hypothetical protein BHE18_12285 [Rossellomorea aquimaris]|uniref:Uncharacterized protein n=1 Tax=Rossellomorea aquimaris TaxID=189382 RepID=A0A1J6VYW0_9BACI|nr:hypothetical protein BHE18_12285 [Rossellomorea aquimaris]